MKYWNIANHHQTNTNLGFNNQVLVIGNSNMSTIYNEVKKTLEGTFVYVKYPFDFLSEQSVIKTFIAGL